MRMIMIAAAAALVAATGVAASAPARVRDISSVDAAGVRTLEFSTVVAAPPAMLWQALTDAATYRKWGAPVAFVDLRVGGMLEASYDANAKRGDAKNVKQEIVAYLPERMIAFRNVQAAGVPGGGRPMENSRS